MDNLLVKIHQKKKELPKRQRALCEYILANPVEAGMLTISDLANRANIGTATVVRTIQALGYDSVNQFKADLRSNTFAQASSSYDAYLNMTQRYTSAPHSVFSAAAIYSEYFRNLSTPAFFTQFDRAAEQILKAKRVYILALRSALPVALVLEFNLRDIGIPVEQISTRSDYVFDRIVDMTPQDLLLCAASMPATKQTMDVIRICNKKKIPTVMLVSSMAQPIAKDVTVAVSSESFGLPFFSTPTVFAAEVLTATVRTRCHPLNRSKKVEEMLTENHVEVWDPET